MTFWADVPRRLHQPPQPFTYHIGAEMKTHENDAHNLLDYLPPSRVFLTHPSLLTCTYRVNHFSEKEAPEGGKLLLIQWVTILYYLVPLRCHSHHHHLSDDEDQGVLKIVYYAVSLCV